VETEVSLSLFCRSCLPSALPSLGYSNPLCTNWNLWTNQEERNDIETDCYSFINISKFRLLSYLPARSGRIRLSTHEQDSLSSENEIDDADSIDSNDDELPTSNNPNRESKRAGWNSFFDSFLRVGRDSSSNPSLTRNNGGGSRKEDGIGSAFWGRRNTRRSNSGGLRLGVESIRISTTSGINTLLERMSDGRRSNHHPSKSRSRDNLRPFSYQNLESPHSPGTSSNLFDLGEEDELEETDGPIELPHEFALPSMNK
jgi:hypothetical protein